MQPGKYLNLNHKFVDNQKGKIHLGGIKIFRTKKKHLGGIKILCVKKSSQNKRWCEKGLRVQKNIRTKIIWVKIKFGPKNITAEIKTPKTQAAKASFIIIYGKNLTVSFFDLISIPAGLFDP